MPLSLSAQEQKRIARASRVIAAPLDFETPEAWMEATATSLREAVGAATSAISVPAVSGLRVMSPEIPDELTDWYLSFYPLLERVGAFRRSTQNGVVTRREAYGHHYDAMQETAYVQEFLPQIESYDAITMGVRWKPRGTSPDDIVQVVLNSDDPHRPFDATQIATARLLHPALEAGVATYRHLRAVHDQLGTLLDASGAACAVYSLDGRLLHRTPALDEMLGREPHRDRLDECARQLARSFTPDRGALSEAPPAPATFVGARGPYTLVPTSARHLGPQPSVLVTVTPPPPASSLPTEDDVQAHFGLTPRQADVALLLAERHSNKEIAAALGISGHTARHHVGAVLNELGVPRSEVPEVVGRLATG